MTTPSRQRNATFNSDILIPAIWQSVIKLDPRWMWRNPVMFVVEIGAVLTLILTISPTFFGGAVATSGYNLLVTVILILTVVFANYAEAVAEGRGRAQAATIRKTKKETPAKRLTSDGKVEMVTSSDLRKGDVVVVETNDIIPGDGDVVRGVAYVNEAAITGESAPVLKEPGTDTRSSVTGGTQVTSDTLRIRITANPGETFLDRMIALVEGAKRQKTPNEIALNILIAGLTLIFLLAVATLTPYAKYSILAVGSGSAPSVAVLVSLLVCLIPTTIGGLLSAIGIAGMDRVMQHNVLAMSGKAVEASGDVNTLLLDKTGTITLGNRQAVEFLAVKGVTEGELADAAQLSSLADETPEGRSIVVLAKEKYGLRGREVAAHEANFIQFSAYTRMSGVDLDGQRLRKGATEAISNFVKEQNGIVPPELTEMADRISRTGGTPLAVADGARIFCV